ncbi:MAG: magnesium transporter [Eubacteriales bacterium]|nr:magnesium transporter [Eubacteriales bacterium]
MEQELNIEELKEQLHTFKVDKVRDTLLSLYPSEISDIMQDLTPAERVLLFRFLPKDEAAEVFSWLESDQQEELIQDMEDTHLNELLHNMDIDDAVDFLDELPANAVRRLLALSSPDKRKELNRFLQYPEESAGSIMTNQMILIKNHYTIRKALDIFRFQKHQPETLLNCYVVDEKSKLIGVVDITDILEAKDDMLVADIQQKHAISVQTTEDQEKALHIMHEYGMMMLPVLDKEERLVGVVTIDDMLEVSKDEATEDFELMAAISPSENPYMSTNVLTHVKQRFPWLMILMISGMFNGLILGRFEHAFLSIPLLVTFIPMLTDTGGNAGAQSSTLVIRGLATGDITLKDSLKIILKELSISLVIGIGLAIVCFARVYFLSGTHDFMISATVSLAVLAVVMLAKLFGAVFPLLGKLVGVDPALMASPLITTVVDASGLIIFFTLAKLLLNL